MSKVIEVKCQQPYFDEVWLKRKNFEVRYNDRDYQVGDIVILKEWDENNKYSTRIVHVLITYILANYDALAPNHVVFAFTEVTRIY